MRFGELAPSEAIGGRLAHSLRLHDGHRVAKGSRIDEALVLRLRDAGIERVTVALPGVDDVHEDVAAARVAAAFAGVAPSDARVGQEAGPASTAGLRIGAAATGRANVFATRDGLFLFERDAVLAANACDEGVTLATLAENLVVVGGRMVATIKIVPFAVPERAVEAACAALARRPASVRGFTAHRAALVQTVLPSISERALDKTRRVTEARLVARGATLVAERRCAHSIEALAAALAALPPDLDWVLVVGASAIADRRDVVPGAVERLGGTVDRFGLAVDPGNLLMLGRLGHRTVLGLPGCARSPADNGVDRVLDRLACGADVDDAWLRSLAIGGLLGEIVERPSPRRSGSGRADAPEVPGAADVPASTRERERVAVLLLAAGASRRAGPANKLLHPVTVTGGEPAPMVRAVAALAIAADVGEVTAVTGHAADEVEAALAGLAVSIVRNPAASTGMASSLVRGLSALLAEAGPGGPGAVIVCLADMPLVRPDTLVALVRTWRARPDAHAVVPVHGGRRGNPVLLGRARFDDVLALGGDVGARSLLRGDAVVELEVDDPGVLLDHDTPEALAGLEGGRTSGAP